MPNTKVLDQYSTKAVRRARLSINLFLCLFQIALPFIYQAYKMIQ